MSRVARKDLKTSFIHVMVQGVNKEYIFYKKYYIEKYLRLIMNTQKEYNFTIMAYCIMNNHAHFLIYTDDINSFGKAMKMINQKYAQDYNKIENRCGILFRNRYQVEPIYEIKYLVNCIKYIHNNPVKAKIVSSCEEYPYSSYNDYKEGRGISQSKIIKKIFGEDCNYIKLFDVAYDRKYMDIDNENGEEIGEYIESGIREFKRENNLDIIDILSNRMVLVDLIKFLKNDCKIKFVEIREFLKIPRGTMNSFDFK